MKKNLIAVVILVVIVLVLGYLGRHRIRSIISPVTPPPAVTSAPESSMQPTTASSSAVNNSVVMTKTDPAKGMYLIDSKGMTLYIFDKDQKNTSNCLSDCLVKWPAFESPTPVGSLPQDMGVIKRTGGTMQYTYKGLPLYYYISDKKAGDMMGDGVGGIWHLIKI